MKASQNRILALLLLSIGPVTALADNTSATVRLIDVANKGSIYSHFSSAMMIEEQYATVQVTFTKIPSDNDPNALPLVLSIQAHKPIEAQWLANALSNSTSPITLRWTKPKANSNDPIGVSNYTVTIDGDPHEQNVKMDDYLDHIRYGLEALNDFAPDDEGQSDQKIRANPKQKKLPNKGLPSGITEEATQLPVATISVAH